MLNLRAESLVRIVVYAPIIYSHYSAHVKSSQFEMKAKMVK